MMENRGGTACQWLLIVSALLLFASRAWAEAPVTFRSAEAAYDQGLSAFRSRNYDVAIPALKFAVSKERFPSRYVLARIYADDEGRQTDHGAAYELYLDIVKARWNVRPENRKFAPIVASSLTRLGRYVRNGLPEIGLQPDARRAAEYFDHAARMFGHADAQFELALLQLEGRGMRRSVNEGRHWMAKLAREGHSGAQGVLADLFWTGRHVPRDPACALALIDVASKNANYDNRLWISDLQQDIFCGTDQSTKERVRDAVAVWHVRFRKRSSRGDHDPLVGLDAEPVRHCTDGRQVQFLEDYYRMKQSEAVPFQYGQPSAPATRTSRKRSSICRLTASK